MRNTMSTRLDRKLKNLWYHPLATSAKTSELIVLGENKLSILMTLLMICRGNSDCTNQRSVHFFSFTFHPSHYTSRYYFGNEETHSNQSASRHELWKGLILDIRTLPPHVCQDVLILVQWFWSKSNIEEQFHNTGIEIPKCMRE
jgi:hypothetical protein